MIVPRLLEIDLLLNYRYKRRDSHRIKIQEG
jgi:hypothetical protein